MSQPMNREQRRMLKKQGQEVTEDGQVIQTKTDGGGSGSGSGGRTTSKGGAGDNESSKKRRDTVAVEERTGPIQFAREVRSELRKVSWPGRTEVINYSIVVLITVIVLTIFIGAIDWVFSTLVLELFEPRQ
ncbi:MAG: preprotein translocase subunit SecE [Verrucomicrobiales bacterium]